jgi:hypothetical protein
MRSQAKRSGKGKSDKETAKEIAKMIAQAEVEAAPFDMLFDSMRLEAEKREKQAPKPDPRPLEELTMLLYTHGNRRYDQKFWIA